MSASTPLLPNIDLDARRSYRKGANGQLAMTVSPKPRAHPEQQGPDDPRSGKAIHAPRISLEQFSLNRYKTLQE
jgi:hypothetical protein